MKKTISILLSVFLSLSIVFAQDARQRSVETIVSDVLAAMPAQDSQSFKENMADLAKSAPKSVEILAGMLTPASEGKNNLIEYAISGVTTFASDPVNAQYKAAVLEGLKNGASKMRPPTGFVAASSVAEPVPIEKPSTMMSSGLKPRVSTSQS